jgi:hypothetical protein
VRGLKQIQDQKKWRLEATKLIAGVPYLQTQRNRLEYQHLKIPPWASLHNRRGFFELGVDIAVCSKALSLMSMIAVGIYSNTIWNIPSDWWFGTCFMFPYIGNNHPNWFFFRGVGIPPTSITWFDHQWVVSIWIWSTWLTRSVLIHLISSIHPWSKSQLVTHMLNVYWNSYQHLPHKSPCR